jgi:predicted acetyltransferase
VSTEAIEIRPLDPADHHRNRVLMSHAFGKGRVVPPPAPDAPPVEAKDVANTLAAYAGGKLVASLTTVPFDVRWGADATLAMGGIAGVATFAEARGQGLVDGLLRRSLEEMRAKGQTISSLYPFAWAFYRRYGWDWVGRKRDVTLPLRELKSAPEGRRVEAMEGTADEVRALLTPAYDAFARRYRGVFAPDSHRWKDKLNHSDDRTTHVYAYTPEGGAEITGYLLWRYDRDGDGGQVREFVASTPDAYRGLLSLLHYLATQCKTARVTLPDDTPLWSHVMHWDLRTKIEPVFMGRVVDFAAAMAQVTPPAGLPNGAATVAVRDEAAPWNAGVWRLTVEGGAVSCAAIVGGAIEADVALDIQALSQAFWGTPSLAELRAAGRLEVNGEAGFALLAAVLPAAPVYTLDDF